MTNLPTPRVLVTAGPTHEPIDSVRYIGNRSSGRMGVALAIEAARRGMKTTLLLGPTDLPLPPESTPVTVIRFRTTADLRACLQRHWPEHDVLFMAAAVADFSPAPGDSHSPEKIPRGSGEFTLTLTPTPDLLSELASRTRPDQTVIGFALEPAATMIAAARAKLARKSLDAIVANPLETMESEMIAGRLILATDAAAETTKPTDEPTDEPTDVDVLAPEAATTKTDFASWLLDQLPAIRARASRPGAGVEVIRPCATAPPEPDS